MIVASHLHRCTLGGIVAYTGEAQSGLAKILGVHENHVARARGQEPLG